MPILRPTRPFGTLALLILPATLVAEPYQSDTVTVYGQAASIDKALDDQRQSDSIKNVIHSDGLSQLPDQNAAEALQRLPGITIERDQGEGRYVSVRGLGADLNAVTINGGTIPSPESDRRAVALDVIPSELVQSLSVVKSLTPDMDANSLGGTIEVEGLSGFDHDDLFYTLSAEGSYDKNTSQASPKLSGAFSDQFSLGSGTNNLAVALAFSSQKRDFGSDNVEAGGNWDLSDGQARLEEVELRDYDIRRERDGVGLNIDYRPDALTDLYVRTFYSRYEDSEIRNAALVEFEDPLLSGEQGEAEATRELKEREETQRVKSIVFGGERLMGDWTLSGQGSYSKASEDTPEHIAGATFSGTETLSDMGYTSTHRPHLTSNSAFFSDDNYQLDEVEWETQHATDVIRSLRLDLARDYTLFGHPAQVKFGGKVSRRDKDSDQETWIYEDLDSLYSSDQLNLSNFTQGAVDYGLGNYGSAISANSIRSLLGQLDQSVYYDEQESRINDYDMREDIDAAYLMHTFDWHDWRVLVGMRYERTDFYADGTGLRDDQFESIHSSKHYDHWLPGIHVRYQLNDNTQLRAAWTNTLVRPTFGQLAPGFAIEGDEASFGNPELSPLESSNFDLGIEHYFGEAGVASAFLFYKDIDNFIYQTDLAGSGIWTDFDEAETYANGGDAKVYGLELAYSQKFSKLPAPWNGLLVSANATFSHSSAEINGYSSQTGRYHKRNIDLPTQSDRVANLMLGWENERLSLRLSGNYKSEYLNEVGPLDNESRDLFSDDQFFLDFSARYFLTKQLQLTFEAQNLTDQEYYDFSGHHSYNAQYEEYGPTYKIGLTLTHF